jgi:hypothetical protein
MFFIMSRNRQWNDVIREVDSFHDDILRYVISWTLELKVLRASFKLILYVFVSVIYCNASFWLLKAS